MMMTWLLNCEPYEVQTKALRMAAGKEGFAYFMEMGLGKTSVILAEWLSIDGVFPLIVVCPHSLKNNWIEEAKLRGVEASMYVWPENPPIEELEYLHIINYEAFAVGGAKACEIIPEIIKLHRGNVMFVLDESIQIKNNKARRTKAILEIGMKANYRRILSGAPISQGPHDLWAQLVFIGAIHITFNFYAFRNKFCRMGGYMNRKIIGARNEEQLQNIIEPNAFYAKKSEYTDLPEKTYVTRDVEMNKDQMKHYKEMQNNFQTLVDGDIEISVDMAISQLGKLQQISSGFLYYEEVNPITNAFERKSINITNMPPKLKELLSFMEQTTNKVIVTVNYNTSVDNLLEGLKEYNPALLAGKSKMRTLELDLDEEKHRFNNDSKCRIAICQISAAKYGHTLLGGPGNDRCNYTFFYENSFSLDDRVQIEDRNHRWGQDMNVTYVDVINSPVDKRVVKALQSKKDLAEAILAEVGRKHVQA